METTSMKKSLLIAAFGLAFSCAASAQVSTGVAGTLGTGGAVSNYGATAAPTFGAGARMSASDVRVQGDVQPNLTANLPDAKREARHDVNKVENKRDAVENKLDNKRDATEDKVDRKIDKTTR
jgi:hypothetical protein